MSPAKVNSLGLTQKSLLGTTLRMAESRPTIFAGDRVWIIGCRLRTCSGNHNGTLVTDATSVSGSLSVSARLFPLDFLATPFLGNAKGGLKAFCHCERIS